MDRLERHILRVRDLPDLFDQQTEVSPGRPSLQQVDILRIAVVFLHATIEDLVRTVVADFLPRASAESLKGIPIKLPSGKPDVEKATLSDLAQVRGRTIDALIAESVGAFLDRSNYNHPGDIESSLKTIGFDFKIEKSLRDTLAGLMTRRHHIVHRLDQNEKFGRGQHRFRTLSKPTVELWIRAVEQLGKSVIDHFVNTPGILESCQ